MKNKKQWASLLVCLTEKIKETGQRDVRPPLTSSRPAGFSVGSIKDDAKHCRTVTVGYTDSSAETRGEVMSYGNQL